MTDHEILRKYLSQYQLEGFADVPGMLEAVQDTPSFQNWLERTGEELTPKWLKS